MATTIKARLDEVKKRFSNKYNYFSVEEVDDYFKQALNDCLMLKFPNQRLETLPENYYYEVEWIYSRMVELVENEGVSSFTAYSENGVSINHDNTYISNGLRSLIRPVVGTRSK